MTQHSLSRTRRARRILAYLIVSTLLHSVASTRAGENSNEGEGMRVSIAVDTEDVIQPRFRGIGFQIFHAWWPNRKDAKTRDVIRKRWLEMNPSFARVADKLPNWGRAELDPFAKALQVLKETDTEIYLTTWNPPVAQPGKERAAYAAKVAENLAYLVRKKGLTNIKYYCMSNELSFKYKWNALAGDLNTFKDYHTELFNAFRKQKLDVKLLATDASSGWHTVEWACKNMDEITGVYGGHVYSQHALDDFSFYPWWLAHMKKGAAISQKKGKKFILGEFGTGQGEKAGRDLRIKYCKYNETPHEPMVGVQLSEAAIGAMNAGIYATAYWKFMDAPEYPFFDAKARKGWPYEVQWGAFRWLDGDYSTRSFYYAHGLMTRFFRGPATVFKVSCNDELVRVAAIQHHDKKTWSVAIVNRNEKAVPLTLSLGKTALSARFMKYAYDPASVPQNESGDLQNATEAVPMKAGTLQDTIGPNRLAVYTTAP